VEKTGARTAVGGGRIEAVVVVMVVVVVVVVMVGAINSSRTVAGEEVPRTAA
jgi:hypothetical protein